MKQHKAISWLVLGLIMTLTFASIGNIHSKIETYHESITSWLISIAFGIGLAVLDFLLDLVNLRPLVGDGLPQLAALAGGAVAAREALTGMEALKGQAARLETLGGMASLLGWACLALGVIHLVAGGVAFL